MTTTRWFCDACLREWLYAYRWTPSQGCPTCQSADIREVTYQPAFVGADLPRDASGRPRRRTPHRHRHGSTCHPPR
jgi:hypothetical protein